MVIGSSEMSAPKDDKNCLHPINAALDSKAPTETTAATTLRASMIYQAEKNEEVSRLLHKALTHG